MTQLLRIHRMEISPPYLCILRKGQVYSTLALWIHVWLLLLLDTLHT